MPLMDHKEELRCARDIAILIRFAANKKQKEDEENAELEQAISEMAMYERSPLAQFTQW